MKLLHMPARQLMLRGLACVVIGAAILLAPPYVKSTELRAAMLGSYWVGWLGIALGAALVAFGALRARPRPGPKIET